MAAELILAPEAEDDIAAAYSWYEGRRIGLGEDFLTAVDACFEAICRQPDLCTIVLHNYRRALIRRFPFGASTSTSEVP